MHKGIWLALCILCLCFVTPAAALMCAAGTWGEEAKAPFTIDKDRQETESGIGIFIDHRFFIIKPFKGVTAGQEITFDCRIACLDTGTTGELALYGKVPVSPPHPTETEARTKAEKTCSKTEYLDCGTSQEECRTLCVENEMSLHQIKTSWCDFSFLKLGQPQGAKKPNNIAAASTFVDFDIAAWMQTLPQEPQEILAQARRESAPPQ